MTTGQRSAAVPDLPTVAESGLKGYEAMPWLGLMAPAGTPAATVNRLHREVAEILKEPEVQEKFRNWGLDIIGNTPAEFTTFLRKDIAQWDKVIKSAGIKAD
ncbi:Tripartite tricarboxylate transporter family receptor [compost metagenome]